MQLRRWRAGRYFYLVATYAGPFLDAVSPTFEVNFARLEHTAQGRFSLAFLQHTGKWHELFAGLTRDECLASIRDDLWFSTLTPAPAAAGAGGGGSGDGARRFFAIFTWRSATFFSTFSSSPCLRLSHFVNASLINSPSFSRR